jgi:hypothetical protein
MNYNELNTAIDKLIANNPTDIELEEFIEELSLNDNITNNEYTELLNKIIDFKRI